MLLLYATIPCFTYMLHLVTILFATFIPTSFNILVKLLFTVFYCVHVATNI